LAEELAVCDDAAIARVVGLVDDGRLVGVLEGMAVDAVVAGIQSALEEPRNIAMLKRARLYRLEIAFPREQFAR
jgi:hypothetical protein